MIVVDKQAHMWAGAAIAAAFFPFGIMISLFTVVIAAIGREVYNKFSDGNFDLWDILATCIGGSLMCLWLSFI